MSELEEEPLEEEENEKPKLRKNHWSSLSHSGVSFPERYRSDPRTNRLTIQGESLIITPTQEEMAVAWSKKIGTPYVEDSDFQTNFLSDFLKLFPEKFKGAKISDIVFPTLPKKIELTKEQRKALAAERKKKRLELKEKFGFATVDGVKTEIANWVVEPPGLFMGRGQHPMRGRWKPGIQEEDITLNLDKTAAIPVGKWKIINAPDCMWIACWTDKLSEKVKYVWLHDSSSIRQARDKSKYDKARVLEKGIDRVRSFISKSMSSKDPKIRRISTACYLIDKLAMRVGDEKDEDEADTVGASTLRVEHLKFRENAVDFDFFGKDYVRWQKTLEIDPKDRAVIENLKQFCKDKKPDDLIFDGITSRHVNEFLSSAAPSLTAKVFRTYHATTAVKSYLKKHNTFEKDTPDFDKLYEAKLANLEAAIKCNHKRTPPKTFEQSLQKKEERLKELEQMQGKTDKQKARLVERVAKMKKQVELTKITKDYNLNTSLRNYIDPRVFKTWANRVGLDWKLLYTSTLQRKMMWVDGREVVGSKDDPDESVGEAVAITVKADS
ncbi:MAG TPA: DNA topoisomerase I [Nitrososphaerales archaeon]|nr:DNA topoisomerase I [Nitrososphaerales archaeon]